MSAGSRFHGSFSVHPFLIGLRLTPSVAKNAGLVDQRAQGFELLLARRRHRFHLLRGSYLEAGIGLDVVDRHARKQHGKPRFERSGSKSKMHFGVTIHFGPPP